eukprot:TRINITY_DN11106_c0_g1_i1.p1 TRINITY_DN11106_c0_g1~~TRINITY_DN11106_c0_g1_i1.p1  ORF type:complete len:863 (+),score=260.65 TRINITY_DN11106_c0_g1_i1:204-2792(+)
MFDVNRNGLITWTEFISLSEALGMPKTTQRQLEIAGLKKTPGKGPGLTYQELEIIFHNRKIRSLHNRTYNLRSSDENVRVFFKALDYLIHAALTTKDVKNACRVFDFLAADPEFAGEGTSVSGIPRDEEYLWKFLRMMDKIMSPSELHEWIDAFPFEDSQWIQITDAFDLLSHSQDRGSVSERCPHASWKPSKAHNPDGLWRSDELLPSQDRMLMQLEKEYQRGAGTRKMMASSRKRKSVGVMRRGLSHVSLQTGKQSFTSINEPAVVSKLDLFGRIKGVLADLKVQVTLNRAGRSIERMVEKEAKRKKLRPFSRAHSRSSSRLSHHSSSRASRSSTPTSFEERGVSGNGVLGDDLLRDDDISGGDDEGVGESDDRLIEPVLTSLIPTAPQRQSIQEDGGGGSKPRKFVNFFDESIKRKVSTESSTKTTSAASSSSSSSIASHRRRGRSSLKKSSTLHGGSSVALNALQLQKTADTPFLRDMRGSMMDIPLRMVGRPEIHRDKEGTKFVTSSETASVVREMGGRSAVSSSRAFRISQLKVPKLDLRALDGMVKEYEQTITESAREAKKILLDVREEERAEKLERRESQRTHRSGALSAGRLSSRDRTHMKSGRSGRRDESESLSGYDGSDSSDAWSTCWGPSSRFHSSSMSGRDWSLETQTMKKKKISSGPSAPLTDRRSPATPLSPTASLGRSRFRHARFKSMPANESHIRSEKENDTIVVRDRIVDMTSSASDHHHPMRPKPPVAPRPSFSSHGSQSARVIGKRREEHAHMEETTKDELVDTIRRMADYEEVQFAKMRNRDSHRRTPSGSMMMSSSRSSSRSGSKYDAVLSVLRSDSVTGMPQKIPIPSSLSSGRRSSRQ